MLVLILAMGFVNLSLGVALAVQLGFGPPNARALFESLGTMPKANEVADGTDAEFADEFLETVAASGVADAGTPVPPAKPDTTPAPAADTIAVTEDNHARAEPVAVDDEADLANNPFLEQSVLDDVRAMSESLGSPSLANT